MTVYHRAWPHHKTTINANIYASNLLSAKAADNTELWRSNIEEADVRRRQVDTNRYGRRTNVTNRDLLRFEKGTTYPSLLLVTTSR